jgi:hypothetical protein
MSDMLQLVEVLKKRRPESESTTRQTHIGHFCTSMKRGDELDKVIVGLV